MSEPKQDEQALKELRRLLKQIQDMLERTREKIDDLGKRLERGTKSRPPDSEDST
jgi:uncharacterized coiled-coil protein SlyX